MNKTTLAVLAVCYLAGGALAAPATHGTTTPVAAKPGHVIQTDTKTSYDKSTTNKMGTTNQGSMTHTQTTPEHGTRVVSHSQYHYHTPSQMAMANDKRGEVSLGIGGTYSFAKDSYDARLSNTGLAGSMQLLWNTRHPRLAVGFDYSMLAPQHRSNSKGGNYSYKDLRAHNLSLAGKFTFNPWDRLNVYMPMGVGATHINLKGSGTREGVNSSESDNKWGMGLFAGLGVQYNLTEDLFMGLEYRYNFAFVKADDLNSYGKDRYMDFHSAFLKMGMRF